MQYRVGQSFINKYEVLQKSVGIGDLFLSYHFLFSIYTLGLTIIIAFCLCFVLFFNFHVIDMAFF